MRQHDSTLVNNIFTHLNYNYIMVEQAISLAMKMYDQLAPEGEGVTEDQNSDIQNRMQYLKLNYYQKIMEKIIQYSVNGLIQPIHFIGYQLGISLYVSQYQIKSVKVYRVRKTKWKIIEYLQLNYQ